MEGLSSLIERLPAGMVSTHHGELAARARDRWALAMLQEAHGRPPAPPSAVVFPTTTEHVATVLAWASETGVPVVPRGGGSGRSGGAQALKGCVVLDLTQLNRVLGVDDLSQTVEVQAGIRGDDLETALARRGLTLGHVPVSLEISTVGGWIGSAAAGLVQAGYGAIEDLLLGLVAVLPGGGVLRLRPVPRSATGPDIRRLLVGSEGTLAVVTEATLSVSRAAALGWEAFRPNSFDSGLALLREMVQRPFRPLVARLFDEARAVELFGDAGHRGGPVLIVAFDTTSPGAPADRFELGRLAREVGARSLASEVAEQWWDRRFEPVARYDAVMGTERAFGRGVVADLVEVAALWRRLPGLYEGVRSALLDRCRSVGCAVGHVHRSGASLLFSFLIRERDDRAAEVSYGEAWASAMAACLAAGGTVTHHHGVGLLKREPLAAELGPEGVAVLRSIKSAFDPTGVLNPGKLVPGADGEG